MSVSPRTMLNRVAVLIASVVAPIFPGFADFGANWQIRAQVQLMFPK